jgi:hypothetical protein
MMKQWQRHNRGKRCQSEPYSLKMSILYPAAPVGTVFVRCIIRIVFQGNLLFLPVSFHAFLC